VAEQSCKRDRGRCCCRPTQPAPGLRPLAPRAAMSFVSGTLHCSIPPRTSSQLCRCRRAAPLCGFHVRDMPLPYYTPTTPLSPCTEHSSSSMMGAEGFGSDSVGMMGGAAEVTGTGGGSLGGAGIMSIGRKSCVHRLVWRMGTCGRCLPHASQPSADTVGGM